MTPAEMKQARDRLKLTQTGLAQKLGLHVRSIAGYEAGTQRIPHAIELAIETLETRDADPLM
jgi:DNA-binding XRE family transcriptional regulator